MEQRWITPGRLLKFLNIDTQRLRRWYQGGVFGDAARKSGRGYPRKYSLSDVVTARVVQEILDLTHSRSLEITRDLLPEIHGIVDPVVRGSGPRVYRRSDGSENLVCWVIVKWDRDINDWHVSVNKGGDENRPNLHDRSAQARILIPLWRIIAEVKKSFPRED